MQTPDCDRPFHSHTDAITRLLPYHVTQHTGDVQPADLKQDGEYFRELCDGLMERKRRINEKLQQSAFRRAHLGVPNVERLMLERLWAEDNCDMKSPRYNIHGQPLSVFDGSDSSTSSSF